MVDCRTAAELAPWVLNGSLDGRDRDRVREHLRSCESCRRELWGAAEVLDLAEGHPPPALVAAWACGEEVPDAAELAHHFEGCPDCREEVALVRENVALAGFVRPAAARRAPLERSLRRWRWTAVAAMAAAVVVAVVAVLGRPTGPVGAGPRQALAVGELERRLGEAVARIAALEAPRVNVPVVELLPVSLALRSGGGAPVIAADAVIATLILVPFEPLEGSYSVRILDRKGREFAVLEGVEPGPEGDLTVTLTPSSLPSGELTLELIRARGSKPVERYRLRVLPIR